MSGLSLHTLMKVVVFPPVRHSQLTSGSMKILETRVSDSGLYVCVASNIAGNLTLSTELSVMGKFLNPYKNYMMMLKNIYFQYPYDHLFIYLKSIQNSV